MNNRSYFNEEIYLYTTLINESYLTFFDGENDLLDSSKMINLFADQHSETRQKLLKYFSVCSRSVLGKTVKS